MTVSKSKYYMIKMNYKAIFTELENEVADNQPSNGFGRPDHTGSNRLYQDLKRSDVDNNTAKNEKQDLLKRLKTPINVAESSENLYSKE